MFRSRSSFSSEALSLIALSGLGVAMPLLDLFGRYPQFFVAKDLRRAEMVLFGLGIAFLVPLVAVIIQLTAHAMGERVSQTVYILLITVLGGALALAILRKLQLQSDVLVLGIAGLSAGVLAFTRQRLQVVQRFLSILSVAPLVALAIFLFFSPSSRLLWGAEASAAPIPGIGHPAPVVILVFDEFPVASLLREDGTINEQRFPNFAGLAQETTWFRNASSVSPWTGNSLTSALTGSIPKGEKAPTSVEFPRNLFTLLGGSYRMSVHEALTRLCPHSVCEDLQGRLPWRITNLSHPHRIGRTPFCSSRQNEKTVFLEVA